MPPLTDDESQRGKLVLGSLQKAHPIYSASQTIFEERAPQSNIKIIFPYSSSFWLFSEANER